MEPKVSLPYSQMLAHSLTVSQHYTFLRWRVVSTSPKPQAGGPQLVGCPRLLIQYICSCPPYWRPFLHPQPEDVPCRGDRDPPITWCRPIQTENLQIIVRILTYSSFFILNFMLPADQISPKLPAQHKRWDSFAIYYHLNQLHCVKLCSLCS
jgi:hypothetical protein